MRMFCTVLLLVMASTVGCSGFQPVRLQLSPGARIGILNVLEQQMTHVAVGSLRFDSFTKAYTVDWGIPGYINRTIENDLRARGNYTVIPLAADAPAGWKQSMSDGILSAVNGWMPGDLKAFLKQAGEEKRVDVIISVSSYDTRPSQEGGCFEIAQNAVITKGYGLYTKTSVLSGLSNLLPVGQHHRGRFPAPAGDSGRLRTGALQQIFPAGLSLAGRPSVPRPGSNQPAQAPSRAAFQGRRSDRARQCGSAALMDTLV